MEPSLSGGGDGKIAAKRAATGEDRISALPDELLIAILLLVHDAAVAARTSVLSRRWRSVWTLLPDLRIPFFPEPHSFCRALTASQLRLHCLDVRGDRPTLESLEIWLPAAARRLSGGGGGTLVLVNHAPEDPDAEEVNHAPEDPDAEEEMPLSLLSALKRAEKKGRFFEMPSACFENAGTILLDLGFLHAFMPFAGDFAHLTILLLQRVWFNGVCLLGDGVSPSRWRPLWRCPCLQVLFIRDSHGLFDLHINSVSLLELELRDLGSLLELSIEGQSCVELGQMPHLQSIGNLAYSVYGLSEYIPNNSACIKILQPFKAVESLSLLLAILRDLEHCQYLMEDMKVLPNPAILYLSVFANGHSFGASSFHILRMCLGIKKLVLVLLDNVTAEATTPCLPGCVCDEQPNWKTEELLLINLKEIKIKQLSGSEHEVTFVKRLLDWSTALNKMTVTLSSSTAESNAKELCQMFKSLSKPGVCVKLMYHNQKVLYAT